MENLFKKRQERLSIFNRSRNKVIHKVEVKEIPDDVLKSCEVCNASLPHEDFSKNYYVCPRCGHHLKLSARERVRQLLDRDSFKELDRNVSSDGSTFKGYADKLDKYQRATGLSEAVIYGTGSIQGKKLVVAIMDSNFMMGSMGSVVGEKITRAIELATKKKLPIVICCTSGGARMQEGIDSLMQMAKTSAALERHNQAGLLYISVLTHPTTGGVSASFAMLGDIILAEPNALIGFAGRRVIEKTINEVLPKEFQRSEFLLEKGFVDAIVQRKDLRDTLDKLLAFHIG